MRKVAQHPIAMVTSAPGCGQTHDRAQEIAMTKYLELGRISERSSSSQSNSLTVAILRGLKPKIRITDENEQTFSYHSETPSQPNYTDSYRKFINNRLD